MYILGHDEPHPTPGTPTWTADEESKLAELLSKGLSGTEIAKILGKTRMAVLGKKHRMKLKSAKNEGNRPKKTRPRGYGPMPWDGCLHHHDVNGWCGEPTIPGQAYCLHHSRLVYVDPKPKLDVDSLVTLSRQH